MDLLIRPHSPLAPGLSLLLHICFNSLCSLTGLELFPILLQAATNVIHILGSTKYTSDSLGEKTWRSPFDPHVRLHSHFLPGIF